MLAFVASRLASAALVVAGVVCLVFLALRVVPGDPVEVMLGERASPADRVALRAALGLDDPMPVQLARYVSGLARWDLGRSLHSRRPVSELIGERIPATGALAALSIAFAVSIALPLGTGAALGRGTAFDAAAITVATLGVSIPNFVLGPVLMLVFAIVLGWLPVAGMGEPGAWVLPAVTLGTALAAVLSRMIRSSLLEVLSEDYVRTARAKGASERRVVLGHALRNALLPVVTVLGLQIGAVLGGAVITEVVFAWPGLGQLTVEAITRRDYPVLQGCVLVIALVYVGINTLTDLVYAALDPRIRLGSER